MKSVLRRFAFTLSKCRTCSFSCPAYSTFINIALFTWWLLKKQFLFLQVFCFELESEASQRRECDDAVKKLGVSHAIVSSDTQDQFRLFFLLERFLQSPPMLARQMLLHIPPDVQDMLIEK